MKMEKETAPFLWIVDDEWENYELEKKVFAEAFPSYTLVHSTPQTFREDLLQYGPRADAVLSQIDIPVDAEALACLSRCRIVSNYGTGYNNIDVRAAAEHGIAVGYIPGYCREDIADYVISAIYARMKPVQGFEQAIAEGRWGVQAMEGPVHRLSHRELFLVGFGSIGRAVAQKARLLGMKVSAWSPSLDGEKAGKYGVLFRPLEEGLAEADFVSVHLRYEKATYHFMGADRLSRMKPGACLINTARGPVVDTAALVAAVKAGKLGGALLDVLEQEPPEPSDEVLHCPGITVTPHISYYSAEALEDLQRRAAENVVHVLLGEPGADLVTG
jgi:D-3-phosphoglycerate dehydrogenase